MIIIIIIIIIIMIITPVMHGSSGPPSFTVLKKIDLRYYPRIWGYHFSQETHCCLFSVFLTDYLSVCLFYLFSVFKRKTRKFDFIIRPRFNPLKWKKDGSLILCYFSKIQMKNFNKKAQKNNCNHIFYTHGHFYLILVWGDLYTFVDFDIFLSELV